MDNSIDPLNPAIQEYCGKCGYAFTGDHHVISKLTEIMYYDLELMQKEEGEQSEWMPLCFNCYNGVKRASEEEEIPIGEQVTEREKGFLSSLFNGWHSISDKDMKAMTAREGYIRFALRYVGGHTNYPSRIESVIEISFINHPANIINVYANKSIAGIEVQPGDFLFSIPLKKIFKIENSTQKEFSGAFLIHGLGAILQETRYFVAIHYRDEKDIKQHVVFGTTPAIKSEKYYEIFYQDFIGTMTEVNPKALSGEDPEEVTKTDISYQLEKLAELKAKGMLTDEEFSIAKKKIL